MPPHSNSHVPQESQSGKYKYKKKKKQKKNLALSPELPL